MPHSPTPVHRLATLADLDAVYAIYMHKEVSPYLGHDPMPRDHFAKVLSDLVGGGSFYVVEQGGRVQGFYRTSRQEGRAQHVALLGTFAVAPEAHGTGLAKAIIDTAISRLHAQGVTRVELLLEADNPRAFKFYTKLGFEREGILRGAYQRSTDPHPVDEWLMAKRLPPQVPRTATTAPTLRRYTPEDWPHVWALLRATFATGDTYAFAPESTEADIHHAWIETPLATYVVTADDGAMLGTYKLQPNQPGLGSHVSNCGYVVAPQARGQGIASLMCEHSQTEALRLGFTAMQFNLVVSTNQVAVRLWQKHGFAIVGTLPGAFRHQVHGFVDAHVMFKTLGVEGNR